MTAQQTLLTLLGIAAPEAKLASSVAGLISQIPGAQYITPTGMFAGIATAGLGVALANTAGGNKKMPTIDILGQTINLDPSSWALGGVPGYAAIGGGAAGGSAWIPAWTANGIGFYRSADGKKYGCYTRSGVWKQWSPYHPTVFGRHIDINKLYRVWNRAKKEHSKANKMFHRANIHEGGFKFRKK